MMAQTGDHAQTQAGSAPQASQAQPMEPHREANPEKQAKHLGKKLGLSRDQVAQMEPILADRLQQMQRLRADTSLAMHDRRVKAKGIMKESKNKIEAVLNDTQKQQFEEMLQERRARHDSKPQAQ
jgi:hypothetical protein